MPIARCYLFGWGVDRDSVRGVAYLTEAAMSGSQVGCYVLGKCYANGCYGLPVDAKQATKWYRNMSACTEKTANDAHMEEAAAWLREHATD